MFSVSEIQAVVESTDFTDDYRWVQQSLVSGRVQHKLIFSAGAVGRLAHFVECVLASAPEWVATGDGIDLCRMAAEVAELIAACPDLTPDRQRSLRLKAALLCEFADLPAISGALMGDDTGLIGQYFARKGAYGSLADDQYQPENFGACYGSTSILNVVCEELLGLAAFEHGGQEFNQRGLLTQLAYQIAKNLRTDLNATDLSAMAGVVERRLALATRSNVDPDLFASAKAVGFPCELWRGQIRAIEEGLLDSSYDSWGMAAPTGTGKTHLAGLLICDVLRKHPEDKVLYIVPSKALEYEVAGRLAIMLKRVGHKVIALSPQLAAIHGDERRHLDDSSVIVLTPEKADLLLRLGDESLNAVKLLVVDEAHHIESRSRGILLEMYLWRMKRMLQGRARTVFLSAVAPNIKDLAEWMGEHPGGVMIDHRATRMRVGIYRLKKQGTKRSGWIDYTDGTSVCLVPPRVESTLRRQLVQLAGALAIAGPVLIVAKGKRECEILANEMLRWLQGMGGYPALQDDIMAGNTMQRLDSRLEREMYPGIEMRELIKHRIAYHHAGLPPRVRTAVEEAVKQRYIDFVFATTTLAEGVNFPFATVIVESLCYQEPPAAGRPSRYQPVTPRTFWNIAGRAGRPGYDREGQVVLFEPALGTERTGMSIEDYLNPSLQGIEPVRSGLAKGLEEVIRSIDEGNLTTEQLCAPELDDNLPPTVQGTINLLRVGLVHAEASGLIENSRDLLTGSFASTCMPPEMRRKADELVDEQYAVVDGYIQSGALSVELIAELGLSIGTLARLSEYVAGMPDWQLESCSRLVMRGWVDTERAKFIIIPVASRMAELEGKRMGWTVYESIIPWLNGLPLERVKSENRRFTERLENLVALIYSQLQYMLPWGLYAVDRLMEEEAQRRNITYTGDILCFAHLIDAGVPSFDALTLVHSDFERVDATRLALEYRNQGGNSLGVSITGWLGSLNNREVEAIVRGRDNRRVDSDLSTLLDAVRTMAD